MNPGYRRGLVILNAKFMESDRGLDGVIFYKK